MKHITRIVTLGILLFAIGCATSSTGHLPRGAKVVGGGLLIEWEAPGDGTAILVESTTGTTVATKAVDALNGFEFDASRGSFADVLQAVLPVMPTNAQFVLYFVPSPKQR
jgi:hypothetical protein